MILNFSVTAGTVIFAELLHQRGGNAPPEKGVNNGNINLVVVRINIIPVSDFLKMELIINENNKRTN